MNYRKNFLSVLLYEGISIIYCLFLPSIIIRSFGSEVNGLLSSITQFLSFISLLEGGLGAVVLSELYKPLEQGNSRQVREVLHVSKSLFRKLAAWFALYTVLLAVLYPMIIDDTFGFGYTGTLIIILSLTTLVEYLLSITNRLLLQAQQKIYIVHLVTSAARMLNMIIMAVAVIYFPNIHIVKIIACIVFLLQAVSFSFFVGKQYRTKHPLPASVNSSILKNRWTGFSQNLAHFINMNTDVALITIFMRLTDVSTYTVYMIGINALRAIVTNLANSRQSAFGKYYATGDYKKLDEIFSKVEREIWIISSTLFCTCLLLIDPFVQLYTNGITDANYYSPFFAAIMVIAYLVYSIREPYRLLVLSAGKFKETTFGSVMEACINFVLSAILIGIMGLPGVAIGTLCAITFRYIYFLRFIRKDILHWHYQKYIVPVLSLLIVVSVNLFVLNRIDLQIHSYISFASYGVAIVGTEFTLCYLVNKIMRLFVFHITKYCSKKRGKTE